MKDKNGKEVPNCVPKKGVKRSKGYKKEDVSIQDANGNTFAEIIDIIKPEPIKGFKSQIEETTRMQSQTGNVVAVTLLWRGKYYSLKIFFPDVRLPSRKEINDELQKVYPGCRLVHHSVSEFTSGETREQAILDLLANSSVVSEKDNFRDDTLVFDELMTAFSSRYSTTPTIYVENGDILQSPDPRNNAIIYTHNIGNYGEFYGNTEECFLTMVINPQADINKILRNNFLID
jgi:hypothetical protein